MQGRDPDDPAQTDRPLEPVLPHLLRDHGALRVALAGDYFERLLTDDAREAVAAVAAALGATRRVILPEAGRARAAAYVITMAEGGALHLDRLRRRGGDFDPAVRDRLIAGAMIPAAWVQQAQRFRRWYRDAVLRLFDEVDAIIAPATPCTAPAIGQAMMTLDGVTLPVRANLGIHTQPVSFIGLPVVAVPVARPGRLPIGVQIIAAPWREDVALRLAAALEAQGVARAAEAG
jgi:aspartyl-tRNA(Asn)/glutamyl-tRNA(Gln) amidotransferase subunit A